MGTAEGKLYIQARSLQEQGKLDGALELIDRYVLLMPDDYRGWHFKGHILTDLGRSESAIACLRRAIGVYPGDSSTWNNLGVVYARLSRWQESVDAFRQAIKLDPLNTGALMQLSNALISMGDISNAVQMMLSALEIAPDKETLLFNARNCGARMLQGKSPRTVLPLLNKLIELEPRNTLNWNNLAALYEQIGDLEKAADCLRGVVDIDPNDHEALVTLANACSAQGKVNDGIKYCDKAIALGSTPSLAKALCFKAQLLFKLGHHGEGVRVLHDGIARWPDADSLYFMLANLYAKAGDFAEARKAALGCRKILCNQDSGKNPENLRMVEDLLRHLPDDKS